MKYLQHEFTPSLQVGNTFMVLSDSEAYILVHKQFVKILINRAPENYIYGFRITKLK